MDDKAASHDNDKKRAYDEDGQGGSNEDGDVEATPPIVYADNESDGNNRSVNQQVVDGASSPDDCADDGMAAAKAQQRGHFESTAATTPGAVAVQGNGRTVGNDGLTPPSSVLPQHQQRPVVSGDDEETVARKNDSDDEQTSSNIVMVEATAVEEIIATQVMAVPQVASSEGAEVGRAPEHSHQQSGVPSQPTVSPNAFEHVDIDNFDSSQQLKPHQDQEQNDESSASKIPSYKILLIILSIVILFVLVCFIVFGLTVPPLDEIGIELSDPEDDIDGEDDDKNRYNCMEFLRLTIFHLEQLKGKSWIELVVACSVGGVMLYQVIEVLQNHYCSMRNNNDDPSAMIMNPKQVFLYELICFVLELLWFFTTVVILICVRMEELNYPVNLILTHRDCRYHPNMNDYGIQPPQERHPSNSTLEVKREQLKKLGDLDGYFTSACVRIGMLIFLLVGRGKLIFNRNSCDNVKPFWKYCWFWFKITLEIVLIIMVSISIFGTLSPLLDEVQEILLPTPF